MTLNDGWHYYSFMKEEVHGVFIDFQKIQKIFHDILLCKSKSCGQRDRLYLVK